MVDQRFVSTIDEKGESRFFMCGMDLYNVEHYLYIGGVSGETKTTVFSKDAPEYATTRKMLEEGVPKYMECLGLDMSQLPLLWAADFLTMPDGAPKIGEFNCSCLGVTGFLDSRGKSGWMNTWTIFYWGWCVSWGPVVGTFVARISKGRTFGRFIIHGHHGRSADPDVEPGHLCWP